MEKNKKNRNGIIKFFSDNKKTIVVAVISACLGALVMTFFFPERIAKLENGEDIILEVNNHKFSANDLYESLKVKSGNEVLFKMADVAVLKDLYPDREEVAKKYVEEQKKEIYESYQQYYGYSKEECLAANGFANEESFEKELNTKYYYQEYYNDYVRDSITEKELDKFYKESVFGNKSIYLFSAPDESKGELDGIEKMLKGKKTFDEIKEKYQTVSAYNYDSVKYTDIEVFTQNILNKIASTKKNESSGVFTDTTYGNVLIYVVDEEEKQALKDIEDEVKNTLVKSKQLTDEKLYYQAFIHLRESNGLKIFDTELKEFYEESIKQYK